MKIYYCCKRLEICYLKKISSERSNFVFFRKQFSFAPIGLKINQTTRMDIYFVRNFPVLDFIDYEILIFFQSSSLCFKNIYIFHICDTCISEYYICDTLISDYYICHTWISEYYICDTWISEYYMCDT